MLNPTHVWSFSGFFTVIRKILKKYSASTEHKSLTRTSSPSPVVPWTFFVATFSFGILQPAIQFVPCIITLIIRKVQAVGNNSLHFSSIFMYKLIFLLARKNTVSIIPPCGNQLKKSTRKFASAEIKFIKVSISICPCGILNELFIFVLVY